MALSSCSSLSGRSAGHGAFATPEGLDDPHCPATLRAGLPESERWGLIGSRRFGRSRRLGAEKTADRLDIALAGAGTSESSMSSLLVLTGVTTAEELLNAAAVADGAPTHAISHLGRLCELARPQ